MPLKLKQEDIVKILGQEGYVLLGTYVRSGAPVLVRCPVGHEYSPTMGSFMNSGYRCRFCKKDKVAGEQKIPYEQIEALSKKQGFSLLMSKEEYCKNHKKKLKISVVCKCGTPRLSSWSVLKNHPTCMKCPRNPSKKKKAVSAVRDMVEQSGYELLTKEYKDNKQLLEVRCEKHGVFKIRLNDIQQGHFCRKCSSHRSRNEIELFEFIKTLCPDAISGDRATIKPKELDIYVPSKRFAIEYCGLHWHSEKKKGKTHLKDKLDDCKKAGVDLITIFEDEWLKNKDQIKMSLSAKLGKLGKVLARDTVFTKIDKKEAREFLDRWHIQKSNTFQHSFGLKKDGILVGVITYNLHHRGTKKALCLGRLCFGDKHIVGGAEKIFKNSVKYLKSAGVTELVSWSDNRWSSGNVYVKLGFIRAKELPIDYFYFKGQVRFSKQSCQKKSLTKKGAVGGTEIEMATSLGYERIWDCGKVRWEFTIL